MDRETDRVMLALRNSTRTIKTAMWISSPAVLLLYTFMKRMVKHKMVKNGEFDKFEKFLKYTDGKYSIQNIPLQKDSDKHLEEIKKQLDGMGVKYNVLPDLEKSDGFVQIAVANDDREIFQGWQERYVFNQMQGGEKELDYLQKLTNKQTSIINIPFEDKLDLVKDDFQTLGINYAVLPDLKVSDGQIQLTVANGDLGKVEHWYKMYQQNMLKTEELEPLEVISSEQYLAQGVINEQEYIDKAPQQIQDINAIYNRPAGEIEKGIINQSMNPVNTSNPNMDKYLDNPNYVMLTINKETLVENCKFSNDKEIIESGYFASRIPGTWGENELTLLIPSNQVFTDGTTYTAFIDANKKPFLFDVSQKPIARSRYENGKSLLKKYDNTQRALTESKDLALAKTVNSLDLSNVAIKPIARL